MRLVLGLAVAFAFAMSTSPAAVAQSPGGASGQAPAASVGQGWNSNVSTGPSTAPTAAIFDERQTKALTDASRFFNDLKQMTGIFIQTNADGKRLRGRFSIKQPGRFRFDYGSGSKMVIVSDGKYLAIQDHDLKTDDRIELDRTPFRILLRQDVDIMRDAHVLEVEDSGDLIIISMQDKDPNAPGRIRLFLARSPELQLKEWITTDLQGIDTKVEVVSSTTSETIDDAIFRPPPVALNRIQ